MAFDFFNNSNLAFGSKLTKVFTILDRLAEDAENNVDEIAATQDLFSEYLHKNYIVPKPSNAESPCRTDEIFAIASSKNICVNNLKFYPTTQLVVFDCTIFNKSSNKFTILKGSSSLKAGYIMYKESVSNANPEGQLFFLEDKNDEYKLICQYRVDSNNKLNIIGSTSTLRLNPYDISQYISMSKGTVLATNSSKYTSDDYQAVCIVGTNYKLIVNLNGQKVIGNTKDLKYNKRHTVLYLKPKDVITGTYSTIFKINYNS